MISADTGQTTTRDEPPGHRTTPLTRIRFRRNPSHTFK
jgi:hypothetical protein